MKKRVVVILSLLFVFSLAGNAYARTPKIWAKGRFLTCDVEPFILSNHTMLPVRNVSEALGYHVQWRPEDKTVIIGRYNDLGSGDCTSMEIGSHKIYTGEDEDSYVNTDIAPQIVNGRTFVPLRALAEALDVSITWDEANFTVVIGDGYPELRSTCTFPRATVTKIINGTTVDLRYDDGQTRRVVLDAFRPWTPDWDTSYFSTMNINRTWLLNQAVYVADSINGNNRVILFMQRPVHNSPTDKEIKELCYNYFAPHMFDE
ncbi:copper amine oxidase N-terminal domain-containing protein [Aedoeadaptatus acetigenes]|uniref:Copper amine oxidase N-terminal domain-containing protein n=1 Tax=Aedoeadaptatus acetigenes TaxID=2981723 RepID=A0ABV1J5Q6_9FIRM|nr:copper amine oxidase N-terminal domain-containing protein [Peptoniphilaceae bacterium]